MLHMQLIDRRLKARVDYSSVATRQHLVLCFNEALGPPSKADLSIQHAFLQGTMIPGETQLFISTCEYVIGVVERNSDQA